MTTASIAVSDDVPTISRSRLAFIFLAIMVTMFLASLDQTVFTTALPTIVGELDGVNHMLWVTTAYILTSTILMPIYGRFGDLFGRKGLFVFAISAFIAGSVIGGLANDMKMLIAGRAIQGIGGGGLMILSQAIIADIVPARERGKYMGAVGAMFGLSAVAGPLLGGWFTQGIGWRWAFWINVPLGLLVLSVSIVAIKLPKLATRRISVDAAGIATLALAVSALVLFASWGGTTYAWRSPIILSLIALSTFAGVVFVWIERRAALPLIPLHLFKDRNFNLATAAGLVFGVAMFGALAYLPTYLQMAHGLNATQSGFMILPMMVGLIAAAMSSGIVATKTGRYKAMPIAGSVIMAVALWAMSFITPHTSLWILGPQIFSFGVGVGLGMQILVLIVQNSFGLDEVGTATASNNFFREIGASLGSAIVGAIFTANLTTMLAARLPAGAAANRIDMQALTPALLARLPHTISEPIITSYNDALAPVFLLLAPLLLVTVVLLFFIEEKPLSTESRIRVVSDAEYKALYEQNDSEVKVNAISASV